jgi:predicted aspartyl protease
MARGDRVPFLPGGTLPRIFATINEIRDVTLVIDSGAERMVISRRMAAAFGFDLTRPLRSELLVGLGQAGSVPVVQLDHVQVGGTVVERLIASVSDLPWTFRADGLLGLNFLGRFRVTLEFDTRSLVLRPPPARRAR